MGNSMNPHFETAQKTGALTLTRAKLKKLPPIIHELTNLRTLDLSENHFVKFPDEIGKLTLLKQLNMSHNRLTDLSDVIGNLSKLEILNISFNRIGVLPQSLSKLTLLKQVNLSCNLIKEFPLVFCEMKHLDVLDISKNNLTCVPDAASGLQVIELNLNQNQISVVSHKVAECPRLKTLRLEENCLHLESIPKKILTDSKVATLTLDGNLFEPKKLFDVEGYDVYMERYTAVKKKLF